MTSCAGAVFIGKRLRDIRLFTGWLRFGTWEGESPFPSVEKDGFWFANVLGGPHVLGCSLTFNLPGRGVYVKGRAEKAVAPLSKLHLFLSLFQYAL